MADSTPIEWTHRPGAAGATWNPLAGCSLASPGCTHCYAMLRLGKKRAGRLLDGIEHSAFPHPELVQGPEARP